MKSVFKLIHLCFERFPSHFKAQGLFITALIFFSTIVDLLGVATVFPVFSLFLSEEALANPWIQAFYKWSGATSENNFFYLVILIVAIVLLLKMGIQSMSNFVQGRFIYSIYDYYVKQMYLRAFVAGSDINISNSDDVKSSLYLLPRVLANQLLSSLMSFVAEAFILLLLLGFLIFYDWRIVMTLCLTIVPLLVLFYVGARRKNEAVELGLKEHLQKIARSVSIALFGNLDIRLSQSLGFFYGRFKSIVASESSLLNWRLFLTKMPPMVVELVILLAFVIMVVVNLYYERDRDSILLQVGVFGIASLKLMPSINRLLYAILNIKANMYSTSILEQDEIRPEEFYKIERLNFNQSIEVHNVSFCYPGKPDLFKDLSIVIRRGDRIGIVGESGSGKTTFLKLLLGQLQPKAGVIEVDGVKLGDRNKFMWQSSLGMVSQDVFILDDTLQANIAFGKEEVNLQKLDRAIDLASLRPFVEGLPGGTMTNLGEMGSTISGGQRQRIGIARALYNDAQLLLFDEATSSLDGETERYIIQSIENLPKELAIVVITHRLSFLTVCNSVFRLSSGRLSRVVIDEN